MSVLMAFFLDWFVGDPQWPTHPVIRIGQLISLLERHLYRDDCRPAMRRAAGMAVAATVLTVTAAGVWILLRLAGQLGGTVQLAAGVWLFSTTLAGTSLHKASESVAACLAQGDVRAARDLVGQVVSRDTEYLEASDLARATVETVAENTVDGVTAPLFWGMLGGPAGAMAYRAVNTMDSMLGYKSARYIDFGWAAARLDDAANFLPARLTACLLPIAAWSLGLDARSAWSTMRRDGRKHPSPNSGISEAGFAGALGVSLGGTSSYGGQRQARPTLGSGRGRLDENTIRQAQRLMRRTTLLFAVLAAFMSLFWL